MDRRDFIKTTLGAIAASGVPLAGATRQGDVPRIQLQFYCKGQFLHITDKGQFYLACLKNTQSSHPAHIARVYVPSANIDDRTTADFNDVAGWRGFRLSGNIVLTGEDGSPLPQDRPSNRPPRTGNDERPFPDPPGDDKEWNYPEFVPQLAKISPGCKLKTAWRDECESVFGPLDRGHLTIHKPCKKEDTVAVFVWRDENNNKPVRICAATDLVSYPYFVATTVRTVLLNIGTRKVPLHLPEGKASTVQIAQICAPERGKKPARTKYVAGMEVYHFQQVYRVIDLGNAKKGKMFYFTQSTAPTPQHGTKCLKPFEVKDDDIFCPGGEPPP
jgi:hypothetical protein